MTLPKINMTKTGQNITELREKSNLSVKQLQQIFGFSTPLAIYKWQHGKTLPTLDNLVILAATFKTTIDDIIITE